jgi:hypothetical protein
VLAEMLAEAVAAGSGQYVLRATGNDLELVSPGTSPTFKLSNAR